MALRTAPEPLGRRPAFGTAFLLVAFVVLAPPLFLLGPLFLLLVASRPSTGRAWIWVGLSGLGIVRLAMFPEAIATLPNRIILAGAATGSGVFLVLSLLFRQASAGSRALGAVALTSAALWAWAAWSGISITELDQAILPELTAGIKLLMSGSPQDELDSAMLVAAEIARVFAGMTGLQALAGMCLAWAWHHRVASRPLPPPAAPFRAFRFNDHLVWGAIVTLALAVFPVGTTFTRAAQNGLVIWVGLYGARGLAVAASVIQPWPLAGKLLLLAFAALTFPIAIGTLVTVGLADTWMDFRGRRSRPETGGFDAN